jgi:hypothetical protein
MKNSKVTQLQQGDVLLSLVSELPTSTKPIKDKRGVVLAEGEHSGHYHAFADSGGLELLESPNKVRFVRNNSKTSAILTHQEHKPVNVPPGIWQIGIVREKDWFSEMVRPVID